MAQKKHTINGKHIEVLVNKMMFNHTPTFGEACGQNQTLLIFISSDISHVQWCYSAHNKAYKVIIYLLKRS